MVDNNILLLGMVFSDQLPLEEDQFDDKDDEEAIDTLRMWDAISATPDISATTVFVRVFTGADGSHQKGSFLIALEAFKRSITRTSSKVIIVEELSTKLLAAHKWQPNQYVDWLLHSHVHFILGHVHQSLRLHNLYWYMPEALREYQRLTYHPGFPSGDQLRSHKINLCIYGLWATWQIKLTRFLS